MWTHEFNLRFGVLTHTVPRMGMNHIIGLSGGKDSTAMALALVEREPRDYTFVCTPTGNELPEMIAHWENLEVLLGKKIVRIHHKTDLEGLIILFNALPNNRMRWCTRMLKILPYEAWVKGLDGETTSYVGLRNDEPEREGIYDSCVKQDFPLRRWGWGITEVVAYLQERGVRIPERTDCAFCYEQKSIEWWKLWKNHPALWQRAKELESLTGRTFRHASKGGLWACSLQEMQVRFEAGEVPKFRKTSETTVCRACTL